MPNKQEGPKVGGMVEDDPLMTVEDLAIYLSKPVQSIYLMRHRRQLPPGIKLGAAIRYRKSHIDKWLNEHVEVA